MFSGKLVFSQDIDHLPLHAFRQCVKRYQGNHKVKAFTCLDQFLCMLAITETPPFLGMVGASKKTKPS